MIREFEITFYALKNQWIKSSMQFELQLEREKIKELVRTKTIKRKNRTKKWYQTKFHWNLSVFFFQIRKKLPYTISKEEEWVIEINGIKNSKKYDVNDNNLNLKVETTKIKKLTFNLQWRLSGNASKSGLEEKEEWGTESGSERNSRFEKRE